MIDWNRRTFLAVGGSALACAMIAGPAWGWSGNALAFTGGTIVDPESESTRSARW